MLKKWLKRIVVASFLVVVVFVATAWQAQPILATPCTILAWAGTTVGIAVILGKLQEWAFEYISQWPEVPSKWKRPILAGTALVVSFLVLAGKATLCGLAIDMQVVWEAITAAGLVFTANQIIQGRTLEGSRASRLTKERLKSI